MRYADGTTPTKYTYTGQFSYMGEFGLMFFNARFYDPALGRFAQADTLIPVASQGVQAWDRYVGMNNNPVRYNDPSGHDVGCYGQDGSRCKAPLPVEPPVVPTRSPTPYVYRPTTVYGTQTPASYTQTPTVTASQSASSTPVNNPSPTPSIDSPKEPKPNPIAPGTKKQLVPKLGFKPANPDWVDVGIDLFGIVGDVAAIYAPGPGTFVDAVATGVEIVGTTKHFDDFEIGEGSILDVNFDASGLIIDSFRIPPGYGSIFSTIDLVSNFCPTPYLYFQSP